MSDPPEISSDPFNSFPLSDPTIILGDTEVEDSSSPLPYQNTSTSTGMHIEAPILSDPLELPLSSAVFSAGPPRPTRPIKKRGPGPLLNPNHTNKTPRLSQGTEKSPRDLVLNARDLLVQAYSLTKSREEQSKLLDLLEVFREYTERGRLQYASSIIASQVANLETATRKIEIKARALENPHPQHASTASPRPSLTRLSTQQTDPSPTPTMASVVTSGTNASASKSQEWTTVAKKPSKPSQSTTEAPKQPKATTRLILIKSSSGGNTSFSPLAIRNAFNSAFEKSGVKGPVVNTVAKTRNQNIAVTTTATFTASYLLEKKAIWQHLLPFKSAQEDEPWHKVAIHGIPIADFNNPHGMQLLVDEIKTFNNGLYPIGTPYWLTSPEKRTSQLAGSVAVAFATQEEATRAIRNRLYIAGSSLRVEKFYNITPSTQCKTCQGYGHFENRCKMSPRCRLCGEEHATQQHSCTLCKTKGAKCPHLAPRCANCKEAHTSDSPSCQLLIAIKSRASGQTEC